MVLSIRPQAGIFWPMNGFPISSPNCIHRAGDFFHIGQKTTVNGLSSGGGKWLNNVIKSALACPN